MARILYKYLAPGDHNDPVPVVLRTQAFLASDPRDFNDPFEVRPYFDQECHDHYAAGHEKFYRHAMGIKYSLLKDESMVGIPVENAVGFSDSLTRKFRDEIGRRFRVLCLGADPRSPIMWAHYTHNYKGAVVGVDIDDPAFRRGLKTDGIAITYSQDRSVTKLPLAFYEMPPVETYDRTGRLVNSASQEIQNGSLVIYFSQYRDMLEEGYLRALGTKAEGWAYENEIRFIYELERQAEQLRKLGDRWVIDIPPSAIKAIIVGNNASIPMVEGIIDLHGKGAYGSAILHYTTCHPNRFEVQAHESEPEYMLAYFRDILPSRARA
jgi:hypothetical protein